MVGCQVGRPPGTQWPAILPFLARLGNERLSPLVDHHIHQLPPWIMPPIPALGRWSAQGSVYLSTVRLVFLADKPDDSGLAGFDLPLVYRTQDKLNQPIFGCNNLTGRVWPAVEGGGPAGTLPPHSWKVAFKNGGIGTFYPLFYGLLQRAKRAGAAPKQPDLATVKEEIGKMAHTAFVGEARGAFLQGDCSPAVHGSCGLGHGWVGEMAHRWCRCSPQL